MGLLSSSIAFNNNSKYLYRIRYGIATVLVLIIVGVVTVNGVVEDHNNKNEINTTTFPYLQNITEHLQLFRYADEVHVLGPTRFPKPTEIFLNTNEDTNADTDDDNDNDNDSDIEYVPIVRPIFGQHRPYKDSIVAFAAEYQLLNFISFIETARESNFTGDIVLCISPLDIQNNDVWTYLTNADDTTDTDTTTTDENDGLRIIIYAPKLTCYNAENEQVDSVKGGSRLCYGHYLYGIFNKKTQITEPLQDPRIRRTVQILRYELYWIMTLVYNDYSWIFLVDIRDSVFQSNPFVHVPKRTTSTTTTVTTSLKNGKIITKEQIGGLIYMFGENVDATRLGLSDSNKKWITAAYGNKVGTKYLNNKPTICSGATMGEKIAIETYLRSMINEFDTSHVVLVGADQGFHNYLYYSNKLLNSFSTISSIVVYDQGYGIVNNMGALRSKKQLSLWGNGQLYNISTTASSTTTKSESTKLKYIVTNWDGSISSVVHQFDRHSDLSYYFFKVQGNHYIKLWNTKVIQNNLTAKEPNIKTLL